MPFAGPVSFLGFFVVGPAVLIALRVYLQVYVEHRRRLAHICRRLPALWVPTVVPSQNPLLRAFERFVLYLLLPLSMLAFTLKAAILPAWGSGLLCVAVAVIAGHLVLHLGWRWRWKALLSGGAGILVAAMLAYKEWPASRPANLFRADLSNQWLPGSDLKGANLFNANLEGATLEGATLRDANLEDANLGNANLRRVDLEGANLLGANLSHANLEQASLVGAGLSLANLAGAHLPYANLAGVYLIHANLTGALLDSVNLEGAHLAGATLKGAMLWRVNLSRADLAGADLEGVNLETVGLIEADLSDANLSRAKLARADLVDAVGLTQAQLDQACGDETTDLPPGLKPGSNCPPDEKTEQ